MTERCRLCTSNDRDALVDELAADLWEQRRRGHPTDMRTWAEAGSSWQREFRHFADQALATMGRP